MKKKEYTIPTLEEEKVVIEDVIASSGPSGEGGSTGWLPWV